MNVRTLIVPLLLIVAGCGESPTSSTAAVSTIGVPLPSTTLIDGGADSVVPDTVLLPASTLLVTPTIGSGPLVLPEPVSVSEPCPNSIPLTQEGDGSAMIAESSRLEPMIGVVLAYGSAHPDEFGSYGFVWHGDGDASVFVSFTGHLDEHRSELADMVEFPDELIVCQVALPGEASQALSAALTAELAGRFLSISQGGGPVQITLPATEEALAGELVDRYGDAVELTVGVLPYPIERASAVCDDPGGIDPPAGLELAVVPPSAPLVLGGVQPSSFEVALANVGNSPIQFLTGTAIGTILDTNGNVVGSSANIALADVGVSVDLAPGATTTLPGVVGTASCDPRLGYVLPPGDYLLVATVSSNDGSTHTQLRTPAQPIAVGG
jgi:hypothetical protein